MPRDRGFCSSSEGAISRGPQGILGADGHRGGGTGGDGGHEVICTKCSLPIIRGQQYHRTTRGPHHSECGTIAFLPQREADVQRAVVEFLAYRGFFLYRQNAGGIVEKEGGGYIRLAPEGASDWVGWHKGSGRAIQCEIKAPGKKPSPMQRAWLATAEAHGVIAFFADSVEMAETELRRFGV